MSGGAPRPIFLYEGAAAATVRKWTQAERAPSEDLCLRTVEPFYSDLPVALLCFVLLLPALLKRLC